VILAAGVEPGQSSGGCPISPARTHDPIGGQAKRSPGKVPGLSLREERAPGAETKRAGNHRPSSLILWWR
jgi:hypothetical protein